MKVQVIFLVATCTMLGLLSACDEPVDCGKGPGRCLQQGAVRHPAAGARKAPRIAQPADLAGNARQRPAPARPSAADRPPPQRMIDPSQDPQMGAPRAGLPTGQPAADFEATAALVHNSTKTPTDLVRRIMNVAANRNVVGLKQFCTPKLRKNIDEMLAKHKDRFWRHLDKYVDAASNGFKLTEAVGDTDELKHLTVTTKSGADLHPVMTRGDKGWLFDRF